MSVQDYALHLLHTKIQNQSKPKVIKNPKFFYEPISSETHTVRIPVKGSRRRTGTLEFREEQVPVIRVIHNVKGKIYGQ